MHNLNTIRCPLQLSTSSACQFRQQYKYICTSIFALLCGIIIIVFGLISGVFGWMESGLVIMKLWSSLMSCYEFNVKADLLIKDCYWCALLCIVFSTDKYHACIARLLYIWYYIHECWIHTVTGLEALVIFTLSTIEEMCKWICSCPK